MNSLPCFSSPNRARTARLAQARLEALAMIVPRFCTNGREVFRDFLKADKSKLPRCRQSSIGACRCWRIVSEDFAAANSASRGCGGRRPAAAWAFVVSSLKQARFGLFLAFPDEPITEHLGDATVRRLRSDTRRTACDNFPHHQESQFVRG